MLQSTLYNRAEERPVCGETYKTCRTARCYPAFNECMHSYCHALQTSHVFGMVGGMVMQKGCYDAVESPGPSKKTLKHMFA